MLDIRTVFRGLPALDMLDQPLMQADNLYPVLPKIAGILQPKVYVEFGTRLGHSLIALVHGSPQSFERILWADNESYVPGSNEAAAKNLEAYYRDFQRALPPQYTFRSSPAEIPPLLNGLKPDLVYVDGDHSYDGTIRDLEIAYQIGPKVIMVDDVRVPQDPQIGEAVRTWSASHGFPHFEIVTFERNMTFFDFVPDRMPSLDVQFRNAGIELFEEA